MSTSWYWTAPLHQNLTYWLSTTAALEQSLRVIWDAASQAAALILPQINLNSQLSGYTSVFSHHRHSVKYSHSVVSDSLWPHGLQKARLPCPSPTPRACSNSFLLSLWCHPTISFSVVPFSFCLQSFPASGSFPVSQLFASGGQSMGASASASVLPMNIQGWFPLGWTVLISLYSKGLARVFSNTTVQKH